MTKRTMVRTVALTLLAAWPLLALAQVLPPPVVNRPPSSAPRRDRDKDKDKDQRDAPRAAPTPGPATLLLKSDLACSVSIDGEKATQVPANGIKKITVSPGKHLLTAQTADGKLTWEGVVEGKAGQQEVVQIKLVAIAEVGSVDEFDRAAARAWTSFADLHVTGGYASAVLEKSWGFHDQSLSTAVHTVHQQIQVNVEEMKRVAPKDQARRRILDEVTKAGANATKYVELLTKAITSAQRANSWMGEPNDLYAQAKAILPTTTWSADGLATLKASAAFQAALPPAARAELQLSADARDFRFGAQAYHGTPGLIAVVEKGGLAADMGLKAGDRLVSAAGQPVASLWDLKMLMRQNVGKKIEVVFERGGKREKKDLKVPGALPS